MCLFPTYPASIRVYATAFIIDLRQHQAIVDDLALATMSRVKTGTSIACDYKTNDIYYSALTGILPQLGCRDDEQNTVLKEFLAILRSQPMPSLNQITFDAYKEHKSKSNAGM